MLLSGGSVREREGVQEFLYNFFYNYAKGEPLFQTPAQKEGAVPPARRRVAASMVSVDIRNTLNLL
jgi:hypothetical protein